MVNPDPNPNVSLEEFPISRRRYNRRTRRSEPIPIPPEWERKVKAPPEVPPGAEDEWPRRDVWLSQFKNDAQNRVTWIPPQWRKGIYYPGRDCTQPDDPDWEKQQREDVEKQQERLDFLEYGDFMEDLDVRPQHEETIRRTLKTVGIWKDKRLKSHPPSDGLTIKMQNAIKEFVMKLTLLQLAMRNQPKNEKADSKKWMAFNEQIKQILHEWWGNNTKSLEKTTDEYLKERSREYQDERAEEYRKFKESQ